MKKIIFTSFLVLVIYFSYAQTNTFPLNDNVGIGTTAPDQKLVVIGNEKLYGDLLFGSDQTAYFIHGAGNGGAIRLRANISQAIDRDLQFGSIDNNGTWYSFMTVAQTGFVGIGTTTPDNKLSVNGTIHAQQVKVDMTGWSDFVFKPDYRLLKLSEVKSYIDQNSHLPDMPSENEVIKNGLSLGEISKMQTRKIEELTLYLIELKKENDALKLAQRIINKKLKRHHIN